MSLLDSTGRPLLLRDFDFESKPLWFWYDKPTAIITSVSYMDSVAGVIDHDSMKTEIAPLGGSREVYVEWVEHVKGILTAPDILTGHNIDRFDLPLLQAQLLRHGLPGLPPLRTQDTMRLPKKRDMSASQESLINYVGLKAVCPIGIPIYKDHLSIPEWEDAAMGWNDAILIERPSSDVHGHAHLRETLIEKGYLAPSKQWTPARA
jgi:DNA polymerase elongation subunit (family B)